LMYLACWVLEEESVNVKLEKLSVDALVQPFRTPAVRRALRVLKLTTAAARVLHFATSSKPSSRSY
jgi:hypothetical protein